MAAMRGASKYKLLSGVVPLTANAGWRSFQATCECGFFAKNETEASAKYR